MPLAVGAVTRHVLGVVFPRTCLAVVSHFVVAEHLRERPPPPEGAHGWIRYMNKPPRLHHHIIQHSTSNVWFDSIQSESDGDHFLQPSPLLPVLEGCCVEEYGSGLIVVRARPWEEEHGKILEMKHVRPKR